MYTKEIANIVTEEFNHSYEELLKRSFLYRYPQFGFSDERPDAFKRLFESYITSTSKKDKMADLVNYGYNMSYGYLKEFVQGFNLGLYSVYLYEEFAPFYSKVLSDFYCSEKIANALKAKLFHSKSGGANFIVAVDNYILTSINCSDCICATKKTCKSCKLIYDISIVQDEIKTSFYKDDETGLQSNVVLFEKDKFWPAKKDYIKRVFAQHKKPIKGVSDIDLKQR